MRRRESLRLAITTAVTLFFLTTMFVLSQETHGVVSGIVIDARTETPLPQTRVVIPGVGEATTDDAGRFRIVNVPPGRHTLQAVRSGMAALPEDRSVATISLAPGEEIRNVRLRLTPFGSISGQIHDDQGRGLGGVSVQALVVSYQQGRRVLVAPSLPARILNSSTETDEKGTYRLDLPPGAYYISAQNRISSIGEEGGARAIGSAPKTYYPGTPDEGLAATVTVSGGETPGVDFNMATSMRSLHKVYVRLGGTDQSSLLSRIPAGVQIAELRDRFSLDRIPIPSSLRRGQGADSQSVIIDGVPDGAYELFVEGVLQGGGRGRGMTPLDIRGEDLHDVIVTLHPAQDIDGRVVSADPSRRLSVSGLTVSVGSHSGQVDSNGNFVVASVLNGFYPVTIQGLPPETYVADIRYGGTSLHETASSLNGPELQTGFVSAPLQIVVADSGGAVDGIVEGRETAAGATVVLVPPSSRRFVKSYYKATTASGAGTFSFKGVPPGVYQLFAWDSIPDTAWLNPEFMSRWGGRGQAVVIEAGGVVNIKTRLLSNRN